MPERRIRPAGGEAYTVTISNAKFINFMWTNRHMETSQAWPFWLAFHFRVHEMSVTHHIGPEEDGTKDTTVLITRLGTWT